jgi:c(7)-type cytochrome triheme protein
MPESLCGDPVCFLRNIVALLVAAAVFSLSTCALSAQAQLAFLRAAPASADERSGETSAGAVGSESHAARRTIERNDFYDPANPDYRTLQRHDDAMRSLPKDNVGFPDWMRALSQEAIKPRSGLSGKEIMEVLDLDVVMRNTKEMPHVLFPHRSHTLWLACSNCHPAPFSPLAGGNRILMADIFRGQFCGMCHDRVAFVTFYSCNRCHSVPQGPRVRN